MTLEERIIQRYPNFSRSDINKRLSEYESSLRAMNTHIEEMFPRVHQSPEYLSVERIATPLQKHTYGDICLYAWALKDLEGFEQVINVAESFGLTPNWSVPENADDYLSPLVFYGYLWGSLKSEGITLYSQLYNTHVKINRRSYQVSDSQFSALKARGIVPHCSKYDIFFEATETNSFVDQYKSKGFVVIQSYIKSTAETIERAIQVVNPDASLQFDREYGVVIR